MLIQLYTLSLFPLKPLPGPLLLRRVHRLLLKLLLISLLDAHGWGLLWNERRARDRLHECTFSPECIHFFLGFLLCVPAIYGTMYHNVLTDPLCLKAIADERLHVPWMRYNCCTT